MEEIYVFGHKSPDTDTICSAIAYAKIKNFIPARLGEINEETKFVLERFQVEIPELIEDVEGKKVVLVDHNEFQQSAKNIEKADIVEVIDHHKINFSYNKPIKFLTEPQGSTATIIVKYFGSDIEKIGNKDERKKIKGLLLSAILSDTVVFKSPTTTEDDKGIAYKLAEEIGIDDIVKFGIEIKKAKGSIKGKSIESIVMGDPKEYDFNGKKVVIGQVEIVDINEVYEIKDEILKFMKDLNKKYDMVVFMATDIINEGSELFFAGEKEKFEKAFNTKVEGNSIYIKGLMSRKSQVVPNLQKVF